MMEDFLQNDKIALRGHFRRIRNGISPEDRARWDAAITAALIARPEFQSAKTLFSYQSRGSEVSTEGIITEALKQKKTVLVPSADNSHLPEHGFYRLEGEEAGLRGVTGVHYGVEATAEIDFIVVPGLVWDRQGYRTGFGGGYFDRLLGLLRPDCFKAGLAYGCQMVEAVPRDEWDMPVDVVLTELGL